MLRVSPFIRAARYAVGAGLVALSVVTSLLPAVGQAASKSSELARYVPREDLVFYVELSGLDAHADAWKKTAAYRMLNETPLGEMLESIAVQLGEKAMISIPNRKFTTTEVVTMIKHLARSGFAFGLNFKPDAQRPSCVAFVLRDAARKDVRLLFSRLIGTAIAPGKAEVVDKAGRRVVVVRGAGDSTWAWWAEKDDLVFGLGGPESADAVLETLDSKRPNAVEHPIRLELAKEEKGFEPVALGFFDVTAVPMPPDAAKAGLDGLKRVDYRWGFQDKAVMSVTRLVAPSPRRGILALIDQPTFGLQTLPPLPAGINGFMVLSLDPDKLYSRVVALAKSDPDAQKQVDDALKTFRSRTGLRLREDLLKQIGPRVALFATQPEKKNDNANVNANANANPLAGLPGMGSMQVPKAALLIEVDNPRTFAKTLDQLMTLLNKELKKAPAGPPGGGPGAAFGGPPGGGPGAAPNPGDAGGTLEFKATRGTGSSRSYVLTPPPGKLPPGVDLRPTIRLGKKFLIVATSPDEAQEVAQLEAKTSGHWKPTGDFTEALAQVPKKMTFLTVGDPRDSLPQVLSQLPTTLNMAIGMASMAAMSRGQNQPGGPGAGASPLGGFQVNVPADKTPSADAIRERLFPEWTAVAVDDKGMQFVTREAFPSPSIAGAAVGSALLLPAVQSAREAARRAQCTNNLKQIALAFLNYASAEGSFPPAAIADKQGKPLLSWRVALLPYLDQKDLYDRFKLDEPWDGPNNKKLLASMPKVFACPSRKGDPTTTPYRVFQGKGAIFEGTKGAKIAEIVDGTSNTILAVEAAEAVPWTKPDDLPFDAQGNQPTPPMSTSHPNGFNALFADGSVRFIKKTITPETLKGLITRAGAELIPPGSY